MRQLAPRTVLTALIVSAVFASAPGMFSPAGVVLAAAHPTSPDNVLATPGPDAGQITLTWTAPTSSDPLSHYQVWVKNGTAARQKLVDLPADATAYVHTVVDKGIPYTYDLRAVFKYGTVAEREAAGYRVHLSQKDSLGVVSAKSTAWAPAPTPVSPSAAPGAADGEIAVSWSPPASGGPIGSYKIYAKPRGGFHAHVGTVDGSTLSFTLGGLDERHPVAFNVSAVFTTPAGPLEGNFTSGVSSFPLGTTALEPSAAPGPAEGQVSLAWTAPTGATPVDEYRVYRRTLVNPAPVLTATVVGTNLVQSGLDVNVRYFYTVAAAYSDGLGGHVEADESLETSAVPLGRPLAPRGLGATLAIAEADDSEFDYENLTGPVTVRTGVVVLTWEAPARDGGALITIYTVYRSVDGGAFSALGTTDGGNRTLEDTTCPEFSVCGYRVSATNAVGEGPLTATVSVRAIPHLSEEIILP